MFDILRSVDGPVANEALYLLGLRFHERPYFPGWRYWMRVRSPGPRFPESFDVATEVIEEIESRTGRRFEDLSEPELAPYRTAVYDIVEQRRTAGRKIDPAVAHRILEEMRRDYGHGHWRAVA
jgi:hypothetical protein